MNSGITVVWAGDGRREKVGLRSALRSAVCTDTGVMEQSALVPTEYGRWDEKQDWRHTSHLVGSSLPTLLKEVTIVPRLRDGVRIPFWLLCREFNLWQCRTEGELGGSNPPRNSEGPPKSCQTQPECENC